MVDQMNSLAKSSSKMLTLFRISFNSMLKYFIENLILIYCFISQNVPYMSNICDKKKYWKSLNG